MKLEDHVVLERIERTENGQPARLIMECGCELIPTGYNLTAGTGITGEPTEDYVHKSLVEWKWCGKPTHE